jgi:hypothetical protein
VVDEASSGIACRQKSHGAVVVSLWGRSVVLSGSWHLSLSTAKQS